MRKAGGQLHTLNFRRGRHAACATRGTDQSGGHPGRKPLACAFQLSGGQLMKGKRILPVMAMFAFGLVLGTGVVLANHPWICSGSTAYHWSSRTVNYPAPTE